MRPSKRIATHRNEHPARILSLLGFAIAAGVACGGAREAEQPVALATLPSDSDIARAAGSPPQSEDSAEAPLAPLEPSDRYSISPATLRARDRAAAQESGACPQPAPTIGYQQLPAKPASDLFSMPVRSPTMRSQKLLSSEIQSLERLFQATPERAPDRPNLLRRLAEGYVELESAAVRDKTSSQAANQAAVRYYTQLKNEYPKWCKTTNALDPAKNAGCTDEVLYYLAQEYQRGDDLNGARRSYLELLQTWPQSRFVPNAYLAFGELFFKEAVGDPSKWALAEQSYMEVIKYPPPENRVWGYAHYKLGFIYWHKGDGARALSELKKTIEYSMQYPSLPHSDVLRASARQSIVPVFALVGDPRRAYDFFRPLVETDEKAFETVDELGELYMSTNHLREAAALYDDLSRRDAGLRRCHEATAKLAAKHANAGKAAGE
jgi:tetratricopeptide (TPR) repeat protein